MIARENRDQYTKKYYLQERHCYCIVRCSGDIICISLGVVTRAPNPRKVYLPGLHKFG